MSVNADHPLDLKVTAIKLPRDGMPIAFEARADERAALATRLDVVAIEMFRANLMVRTWERGGVRVEGKIQAQVIQNSIVTLEDIVKRYDYLFAATFVPAGSRLARVPDSEEAELYIDPEGEDPPEVFTGDMIDLSPYLAESLALELDLYPRLADERFDAVDTDPEPEAGKISPFAKLAALPGGKPGEGN